MNDILDRHGITSWQQMLEIAESASAPDRHEVWCDEVEFGAAGGWKVAIFYDCCELDYISYFVTPGGEIVDFWDWPDDHPWKEHLTNWYGGKNNG